MIAHAEIMLLTNVALAALCTGLALVLWKYAREHHVREEELMGIIIARSSLIEMKDGYTEGHCARVKKWAAAIGRGMQLSDREIDDVVMAAVLHDIGKIGIPDSILQKAGRLSPIHQKLHDDAE